ncbi:MAG: DUF983 domain-containing protein [Hyphomicrobiaceae bacterium]|nr:DUF983 domain-containing protein [Hyphomicrobiaceae bacterium]
MTIVYTQPHRDEPKPEPRSLGQSLWRGARCKCPACGEGKLFRAYLKVNDTCPACGEDLSQHRADDAPPYITIVLVGHILVGLLVDLTMVWHVEPYVLLMTIAPLAVILPLVLLPSIKGMVVGLQWALRMHGFSAGGEEDFGSYSEHYGE